MQEFATVRGESVPKVGFGTYQTGGYETAQATKTALKTGYRHIDTAMAYENEAVIGRVIEGSDVDREDIFLTTKVKGYSEYLNYDGFVEAAKGCLERLGMDYVDLLLVHWWERGGDIEGVCAALDHLVEEGLARNVGVSNFSVEQLEQARQLMDQPLFTNQVEYHPYFYQNQQELLSYCQKNDIILTGYSPLAEGMVVNDELLAEIGRPYGKSAAQVAIRWQIQQDNVITIPKSVTPSYIRQNIDVFDFELTEAEMRRVAGARGPPVYEFLKEGGPVSQFRASVGPRLPDPVRAVAGKGISAVSGAAMGVLK
jgi:diketogulonate reductase-like aldo/keto reductase